MRHPSSQAVFSYWSRLRGNRAAPGRAEVDPRALAAHLGDIFLLDAAETGHTLRLAGSRMEAVLGNALVGRPFASLFSETARREALQALSTATVEGEPILVGLRLLPEAPDDAAPPAPSPSWLRPRWPNQRPLPQGQSERRQERPGSGEMLLLPLEHRGRVGARVLGVFGAFTPPVASGVQLAVTGERILGPGAQAVTGSGLTPGATLVAREGVVRLFRDTGLHPMPENDR